MQVSALVQEAKDKDRLFKALDKKLKSAQEDLAKANSSAQNKNAENDQKIASLNIKVASSLQKELEHTQQIARLTDNFKFLFLGIACVAILSVLLMKWRVSHVWLKIVCILEIIDFSP